MSDSPLSALVQGFVLGREQQEKKARAIAQQQAEKFEQDYRVSQAKQQASYQANQLHIQQQQANTAEANQKTTERREADQAEAKVLDRKSREMIAQLNALVHANANFLHDKKNYLDWYGKFQEFAIKYEGAANPEEARAMAQQKLAMFDANFAAPAPAAPDGQGGYTGTPPAYNGLSQHLLQGLGAGGTSPVPGTQPGGGQPFGQQQFVKPPAETPAGMNTPNPAVASMAAALAQKKAQTEATNALARQRDAKAQREADLAQTNREYLQARTQVEKLRGKKLDQDIAHGTIKGPLDIAKETAEIAHLVAETSKVSQQTRDLKAQEEDKRAKSARADLEMEALRVAGTGVNTKVGQQLSHQHDADAQKREAIGSHMMEIVLKMGIYDGHLRDPATSAVDRRTYEGLQLALRNELALVKDHYADVNADLQRSSQLLNILKTKHLTTPGGHPDVKGQKAHERAVDAAAAQAIRERDRLRRRPSGSTPHPQDVPVTIPGAGGPPAPLVRRAAPKSDPLERPFLSVPGSSAPAQPRALRRDLGPVDRRLATSGPPASTAAPKKSDLGHMSRAQLEALRKKLKGN